MGLKYRIGGIGWYNFETLVQTLLKVVVGPGVTSFGGIKDPGRDAACSGAAPYPSEDTIWHGYWVFQAKYVDVETIGVTQSKRSLIIEFTKEVDRILTNTEDYLTTIS